VYAFQVLFGENHLGEEVGKWGSGKAKVKRKRGRGGEGS